MGNRSKFTSVIAALILAISFAGCGASKDIAAGSTWEIVKTVELSKLTIAEGAVVKTSEGHSLTMTVDGVETPIKAGTYKGNVVLTVTDEIIVEYNGTPYKLRAAVDIEDGKYMPNTSVAAAVSSGKVSDTSATDVSITSIGENFNGIIARGNTTFSINKPKIDFTGYGGSDFAGVGAAIMSDGKADVTVNNASIATNGSIRSAIVVRGSSTIHVNDSSIEVHNGPLPENYSFSWTNPSGALMQVPWMLGLIGTCRATNIIENGTAFYSNTDIKAQGWGAFSVDDTKKVRLTADKCTIETIDSGYGAYSIGDCIDTFSGCKINVHDMALIMANETASGVFTDGTVVNSGRFGVMVHAGNYGTLTINKGAVFNTTAAVIQVKSSYPNIEVEGAELNSKNGVILQAIVNDDPNMSIGDAGDGRGDNQAGARGESGMAAGAATGKDGGPGGRGGAPGGTEQGDGKGGAPSDGGMPGGSGNSRRDITASFKDMTLKGDIINSMTTLGNIVVKLEKTAITGAITTATAEHAVGRNGEKLVMQDKTDLYYLIGEVNETYCATGDKYGIKVSLDGKSSWIVDNNSYLTGLTIADGAAITAPEGYRLTMTVDGVITALKTGDYNGKIILTVTKIS